MGRLARLLIPLALLPMLGTGCQVISALSDYFNRPPDPKAEHDSALPVLVAPRTVNCGSLTILPNRPLLAISLAECRYVALARGRVKDNSFPLQLGNLRGRAWDGNTDTDGLSTSRAMLQLTEDLIVRTEQSYWALYQNWWTLVCNAAILDLAGAQEAFTQRLLDGGQSTRYDLEQARQSRVDAQTELFHTLANEATKLGLLDTEQQLREGVGLPAECALLLPADCPVVGGPLPECAELMEQAQQYRLDLQQVRAGVQLARRRLQRASTDAEKLDGRKGLELAEASLHDGLEQIRLEMALARERVHLAREAYCQARQKRQSSERVVQARHAAAREKVGTDQFAFLQAQRILVEAVRAEYQAAGNCALTLLELERLAGVLLVRSGITMPTPGVPNTPRALMPQPAPLQVPAGLLLNRGAQPPLQPITEVLTTYEGLALVEWLDRLQNARITVLPESRSKNSVLPESMRRVGDQGGPSLIK
jgi:hypothetical protein